MKIVKIIFRIAFITIILVLFNLIISKSFAYKFEIKSQGMKMAEYEKNGDEISPFGTLNIDGVSSEITLFNVNDRKTIDTAKGPMFYCIAKDTPIDDENTGKFLISSFIEIGPEGWAIKSYGPGATTTTLNEWIGGTPEEIRLRLLYYILTQENHLVGYGKDLYRQNLIWEVSDSTLPNLGIVMWEHNEANVPEDNIKRESGYTAFANAARAFASGHEKITKTVRIWYLYNSSHIGLYQSLLMVTIGNSFDTDGGGGVPEKGSITVVKKDSVCGHEVSGAKFSLFDNNSNKYIRQNVDIPTNGRMYYKWVRYKSYIHNCRNTNTISPYMHYWRNT